MKKVIFFVGNAHLDPVWMWHWQEGSCEAKATIRSALDRMKEYPDFKFVCSASVVFQWIEEFDPQMLEEVKERVKEGRFRIVGGWFVQPDCNLPAGESFARHGLYGQRYFKNTFGTTATIGYNVDSFGHNLMLPQILKKSGMNRYVFMRPMRHEKEMPSELFQWKSPDGSEVTAFRIMGGYAANLQNLEDLEARVAANDKESQNPTDSMMFFYGVGNHGGGPTKKNINAVMEFAKTHPDRKVIFSDVVDFFDYIEPFEEQLPVHTDDLQHHASGCYSAVSSIKNDVRRTENALINAEKFSMMANALIGKKCNPKKFEKAWKNTLFCHFHDILGGCCIQDAYEDVFAMLGESRSFAKRTENNALQSISWKIDTHDFTKGVPVILFNPNDFDVEEMIPVNKQVPVILDGNGNRMGIQYVRSQVFSCKARDDTAFMAKIPALGYATYYMKSPQEVEPFEFESPLHIDRRSMENENLRISFEEHTGYITSIFDKVHEKELLNGFGAVPIVIDEQAHDTWSHGMNYFDREMAKFGDATMKITESGPLRVTLKVVNRYNDSTLVQYFSLRKGAKTLDVKAQVDWHERYKMLKLAYDTIYDNGKAYYEIPFGVIERPANGEEEPCLSWVAIKRDNDGLAILNNNKYSFSIKDGTVNLTVVRSPLFADHGRGRDEECTFTDQGIHNFSYMILPMEKTEWSDVIREAKHLNNPVTVIMENNHNGILPTQYSGYTCSTENIILSAIKPAEDGEGIVLRAYETNGREVDVTFTGSMLPAILKAHFGAFGVNTYYYSFRTKQWKEVLMTEYEQ